MSTRVASLRVEELETRDVPSCAASLPVSGDPPTLPAAQQSPLAGTDHAFGTIRGTYAAPLMGGVDAGIVFALQGGGQVHFLGAVHLTGTLQGTGNIAAGRAGGEITLSDRRGSLTLQLEGPVQGMFAPMPHEFGFTVVKATGAFQGIQATGWVGVVWDAAGHTFKMVFESVRFHDREALSGGGRGDFTVGKLIPDAGTTYDLTGGARVGLLGQVSVSGSVHSTGFTHSGRATGELTLTNGQGSVTLELTGPVQPGFAPLPEDFHFTVVRATGAYRGLKVSGSLDLRLDPIMWLHAPAGGAQPLPGPWEGGGFRLTIHPRAG